MLRSRTSAVVESSRGTADRGSGSTWLAGSLHHGYYFSKFIGMVLRKVFGFDHSLEALHNLFPLVLLGVLCDAVGSEFGLFAEESEANGVGGLRTAVWIR